MNKLNAIIIEDEIPAARLLHSMITRLRPQWTLTIVPGSVDEAASWRSRGLGDVYKRQG